MKKRIAAASGDTAFHDAIRKEVLAIGTDSYYGNTAAMLCSMPLT